MQKQKKSNAMYSKISSGRVYSGCVVGEFFLINGKRMSTVELTSIKHLNFNYNGTISRLSYIDRRSIKIHNKWNPISLTNNLPIFPAIISAPWLQQKEPHWRLCHTSRGPTLQLYPGGGQVSITPFTFTQEKGRSVLQPSTLPMRRAGQ